MGRQKKVSKPKEPVRIRQRKLKNGNISLYLDIYSDGVRKYESLSLYLVPEKDPISKDQNRHAMYNPQIEMFAHFKTKSSFHKTKGII